MLDTYATGIVVNDPELREIETKKGPMNVCEFRLACSRGKDQPASFICVTAWKGWADYIAEHCEKGDLVFLKGALTVPQYDKAAHRQYSPYITVQSFSKLQKGKKAEAETAPTPPAAEFELLDDDDLADLPFQ